MFYEVEDVPVHSVRLLQTRQEARSCPKGDIALGLCETCDFIFNTAFDARLQEYDSGYEATQSFSPTFNAFARRLAARLVDQYDLHDKTIIEIGCGQGEFLTLLCELGDNRGIGFDPAYVEERTERSTENHITFIKDYYSEKYAHYRGDFVYCKMTLEHIENSADFVRTVRRSLRDHADTTVFFQVPDVSRILQELAFWDVYYEHCSYFSLGSLAGLFRRCGFEVLHLARDYNDQYLLIEAKPKDGIQVASPDQKETPRDLTQDVRYFAQNCSRKLQAWRRTLQKIKRAGQRAVIWGAGSKGVAFLTTLDIHDEIEYAVDINPFKQGTYMAGTGQEIVAPDFLMDYKPDIVIVMNPIYFDEIQQELDGMGVRAELMPI